MHKRGLTQRGFTIVELMIVIVVVGILVSITTVTFGNAQEKARDTARMTTLTKISQALELYYLQNGRYPAIEDGRGFDTTCDAPDNGWGHVNRLKTLTDALDPFEQIDPVSLSQCTQGNYYYSYASQIADNRQSYGLMVYLEDKGGQNDGGYYANAYELGDNPKYCMANYTGANANWLVKSLDYTRRCYGGN